MLPLILGHYRSRKNLVEAGVPQVIYIKQHGEDEGYGPCGLGDGLLKPMDLRTDPGVVWEHPWFWPH